VAGKDWYSPREIRFTRVQCLWLIRNLPTLRAGYWPTEASNYISIPGKKSGKHRAYFETPVEYAVEIQSRLERAGLDGLILLAIEGWDMTVASLAAYLRCQEWTILRRRKRALRYVSGWRRKPFNNQ